MSAQTRNHTKMASGVGPSSTTAAVSGKRRLDFDDISRTFRNKTFFLDLPGNKNVDQLERELTQRGGKVEKFFHRDVKYLITTRSRDDRSTPSPLTPSGGRGVALMSPLESISPVDGSGRGRPAYQTRAAQMLAASIEKQGPKKKTIDFLAMAKSWGCKVITLESLLSELKKLKPLPRSSRDERGRAACGKVHSLRGPYVKVDDQSRAYRPLVHETKSWPRPRADTSPNGCPFDPQKVTKARPNLRSSAKSKSPTKPRPTNTHSMVTRLKKPGYCECCSVRYEDLVMHLRSGKHIEYATTDSNFSSLDQLISQGQKFSQFVSGLRKKYKNLTPVKTSLRRSTPVRMSPRRDDVVLVTPPSTKKTASPLKQRTPLKRNSTPQRSISPSPRGRKSPRLTLSRPGMALRPNLPSPPPKSITLKAGTYTSPKTGELRITPIVDSKEYTPGFDTPLRSVKAARIEAIAQKLANFASPTSTVSRKRTRSSTGDDGVVKKARFDDDFVPETPDKANHARNRSPSSSTLCNLDTIFERIHQTRSKSPVTRDSPSKAEQSPSGPRKSPRLIEKERKRFQMKVTTQTEQIKTFSPSSPKSLVVSFNLTNLKSCQTKRTPALLRCLQEPISNGITPEIALQGNLPTNKLSTQVGKEVPESPLVGLVCQRLFESSESESSFAGFSPCLAKHALLNSSGRGHQFDGFSPLTVRQTMPDFASRFGAKVGSQGSRKRVRSSDDDGISLDNVITPESKRRKVAARRSPRKN